MVTWYCWVSSLLKWHESTLVAFRRSTVQPTAGRPQCHEKLCQSIRTNFKHPIKQNVLAGGASIRQIRDCSLNLCAKVKFRAGIFAMLSLFVFMCLVTDARSNGDRLWSDCMAAVFDLLRYFWTHSRVFGTDFCTIALRSCLPVPFLFLRTLL